MLLSSYLDNWWSHELQDLSSIILWSYGRQVEKKGRAEIQKIEYLENEKSFLDEIKSIFHSFWRAIIWWKNENLMKIVDTSFNSNWADSNVLLYQISVNLKNFSFRVQICPKNTSGWSTLFQVPENNLF